MATLGQLALEPFGTAPVGDPPATAPAGRWVVLVDAGGPVSVLAPGTSLTAGGRLPGILVAAADLDLRAALASAAFQWITDVTALVLTEPGAGRDGQPGIAGVVSGQTLTRAVQRGTTRGVPLLPGVPSIPLITRSCGFAGDRVTCATVMSFPTRPPAMPNCRNDRGLTAHAFDW